MITNITIQNFGCFDDHSYSLDLNKFTVLIGPNNSGKSTFFKGLNLVRSIPFAGGGIVWNSAFYSLNSYENSVYNHDIGRVMFVSTKYTQDSNNFRSTFGFRGIAMTQNEFVRNEEKILSLSSKEHRKIASTVWYIAPSRTVIPHTSKIGQSVDAMQPLHPSGNNVSDYLVGRFTSKDPNWTYAEKWLKKIDKNMTILKTPIVGNSVSMVTTRNDASNTTDVNMNLQGSGIQNATTIITALVFSPRGSTIILEEPETFLHPKAIETIIDLCNDVIEKFDKQIIITTHSLEMLYGISSDLQGHDSPTESHVPTKNEHFKCITISNQLAENKITEKNLNKDTSIGQLYDELTKSETV